MDDSAMLAKNAIASATQYSGLSRVASARAVRWLSLSCITIPSVSTVRDMRLAPVAGTFQCHKLRTDAPTLKQQNSVIVVICAHAGFDLGDQRIDLSMTQTQHVLIPPAAQTVQ
jgi:hypothetical protein